VGATIKTAKERIETRDFGDWLKLPELANVILLGMRNPFINEGQPEEWINWEPNLPAIDSLKNKRVDFWKKSQSQQRQKRR
jgi:hypothetical protein